MQIEENCNEVVELGEVHFVQFAPVSIEKYIYPSKEQTAILSPVESIVILDQLYNGRFADLDSDQVVPVSFEIYKYPFELQIAIIFPSEFIATPVKL